MIPCRACGTHVSNHAARCHNCGARIPNGIGFVPGRHSWRTIAWIALATALAVAGSYLHALAPWAARG